MFRLPESCCLKVYISSVLTILTTVSLEAIVPLFVGSRAGEGGGDQLQLKGTGVVVLRRDAIRNKAANSAAII